MKNRVTAGVLAIVLGAYGAHHFYLGRKQKGVKCLLISLLTFGVGAVIMEVFGIVEGIKTLTKTDEQFQADLAAEKGIAAPAEPAAEPAPEEAKEEKAE